MTEVVSHAQTASGGREPTGRGDLTVKWRGAAEEGRGAERVAVKLSGGIQITSLLFVSWRLLAAAALQ